MTLTERIRSWFQPTMGQPQDHETDPRLDPANTLHDPGQTLPNPSLEEEMEGDA